MECACVGVFALRTNLYIRSTVVCTAAVPTARCTHVPVPTRTYITQQRGAVNFI